MLMQSRSASLAMQCTTGGAGYALCHALSSAVLLQLSRADAVMQRFVGDAKYYRWGAWHGCVVCSSG
jgi:hypothetical protein